jgi:bacitracin transport system permease protein
MLRALQAEVLKLKGSRMPFWTGSVVLLAPLLTLAAARGRPGGAALLGWTAFMRSGAQLIAGVYGIMLFGLVAAYLFGREYVEGTANEMLTLPLRRESFIVAKMVVLAVWVLALTVFSMGAQAVYAALVGVGGPSW